MRIISGRFRGKKLTAPEGWDTRPTSDRAREAAFNLLAHTYRNQGWRLDGAKVLDVFAGTGALGLEALSRGAGHVTFFENSAQALGALRANVRAMKADAVTRILSGTALNPPLQGDPASIILMDAPYGQGLSAPTLNVLAERGWIARGGLCVVELEATEAFATPEGFELLEERRYGKARFAFLKAP